MVHIIKFDFKELDWVDENSWKDIEEVKEEKMPDLAKKIVPIPEYAFIFRERVLVEIVQEKFKDIKNMDVVGIPASSTLYPTLKGPKELYVQAGRLKINYDLSQKLYKKEQPFKLTDCIDIDAHDLKPPKVQKEGPNKDSKDNKDDSKAKMESHNIKRLLFVACPTELFK